MEGDIDLELDVFGYGWVGHGEESDLANFSYIEDINNLLAG